jgi:TolA-binding protein
MIEPSLPDLQDHISKFQAELKQMRHQFEARKVKLTTLISRRAELQAQLQQVENDMTNEIAALAVEGPLPAPSPAPPAAPAAVAKPVVAAKPVPTPAVVVNKTPAPVAAAPVTPSSLKTVLLQILKAARKPMNGSELTDRVLATGYQTTSKRFAKVVGTQLSKLQNVEHIKGEGYQLRR